MLGRFGAVWGISGVAVLLCYSISRLSQVSLAALEYELFWYHWMALALNISYMAYAEGYRGFQKGFSPRVVARAKYLHEHPRGLYVLLAPFFCMGYFCIHRNRQIFTFILTVMVLLFVILLPYLAQPWRGIVDAGVVVGLGWGLLSLLFFVHQAVTSDRFAHSPEVPNS